MLFDLIEYFINCESASMFGCFEDNCKYNWFCMSGSILSFATMIYSEGE